MTGPQPGLSFGRVVVAMEQGEPNRAALELAARVAARRGCELVGLVVEDLRLLQAADLPVTHLVQRVGGLVAQFSSVELERAFRVTARQAQSSLLEVSQRLRIRHSFQVQRGPSPGDLLLSCGGGDLIVVGWGGRAGAREATVATLQQLSEHAHCPLLVVRWAAPPSRPVTAVFEGSGRPLAAGGEMASVEGRPLRVLTAGRDPQAARRLDQAVAALTYAVGQPVLIHRLDELTPAQLAAYLAGAPGDILVLERATLRAHGLALTELLGHGLAAAVLLLDEPDAG